jgi:acyl carrier protein
MDDQSILRAVNEVFRDVLENPDVVVSDTTTAADVPEWDSLSHVQLVVAIEKRFKLRFTAAEIQGFKNVGEMCGALARKLPH